MKIRRIICTLLAVVLLFGVLPGLSLKVSAEQMDISEEFLVLLKQFEGFSGTPYWDYNRYSIGYGSFCSYDTEDEDYKKYMETPITEEEATEKLIAQLQSYINQVRWFLENYNLTVEQHQFDALVSFTYNCGGGWTTEVTGYFHNAVKSGDLGNAFLYGINLFSRAGEMDYILISRRMSEANMYINGEYGRGYPENFKYIFLDGAGGTPRYPIHGYDANENGTITTNFKYIPSGPDAEGNYVTYEFDGWYTEREGGTLVETLDGSLANGTVLYAHWKTPEGESVVIPQADSGLELPIRVVTDGVNLRSGPGTWYADIGDVNAGDTLTLSYTALIQGKTLWGRTDRGWIALKYTDYNSIKQNTLPRWGTVMADEVNVRDAAGTGNTVVKKLNTGDQIQITDWTHSENMMWGKIEDGWVSLQYVELAPEEYNGKVVELSVADLPQKLTYVQMGEEIDVTGGTMTVTYEDGVIRTVPMGAAHVTGFDHSQLGTCTVTVTFAGFSGTFEVEIVKATVEFYNYDGTLISSGEYAYGEEIVLPEEPVREADDVGFYKFSGWDKEVTVCQGNTAYTATYALWGTVEFRDHDGTLISSQEYESGSEIVVPENIQRPADSVGSYIFRGWDTHVTLCTGNAVYTAVYELVADFDGNGAVNEDDAIYLLRHVLFPDMYGILGYANVNGDTELNEDDAIYLLRHVLFPEKYPLVIIL